MSKSARSWSSETEPDPRSGGKVARAVADAHRREWAAVLAATARVACDIDLAEECVQDAYVAALDTWAKIGVPDNPGAWLTVAARRKALDALRRDATLSRKLPLLVEPVPAADGADAPDIRDDRLRLVFTCCHPALAVEAQVALTLRLVCGLSTAEIARAFLVSEATMAARVTRAKKKISAARIAYRVPDLHELPDRLASVLTVVHLVFTTGYSAGGTELIRADLLDRAIELARMLRRLMPDEPEVGGLLALFLFTDSRRATRLRADGGLALLADQDRSRWDRQKIDEGTRLLMAALRTARPGRFTLQAALAAVHAEAPSYAETDWVEMLGLYDVLLRVWPSPVVALNRTVALAEVRGLDEALAEVARLEPDPRLAGYLYLHTTRADLLRRAGRVADAAEAYRRALELATTEAERLHLTERLAQVGSAPAS